MNTIKYIAYCSLVLFSFVSCDSFLDINPKGTLGEGQLDSPDDIEKLVIAAYSSLGNDWFDNGINSPWPYGDLRGGDAYKGGAGTGDMGDWNLYETFTPMRVDVGGIDRKWYRLYVAISRTNNALAGIANLSEAEFPKKNTRTAEMRFLRAHHLFELKILFKNIVFVDEMLPAEDYVRISNVEYTSAQMWDKIIEEFRFAAANLPDDNVDLSRANSYIARAYLAKALLYAAYEQNEKNEVTTINKTKLEEVVKLVTELSGKYSLATDYAHNFLWEYENGVESIFAVQCSRNDETQHGRLDWGAMLSYPMNPEYGCCGFHQPSQNFVNAFKTDANGLPLFDTFNSSDISTPQDMKNNTVDPRLMHTVAIPGLPYKYKPDFIFHELWNRQPETYGAFMSLKEVELYDCPCFEKVNPFMSSSKNRDIIRYDDALLWKAEALIELGRHNEALPIINDIRDRASKSVSLLVDTLGLPTGNFLIGEYVDGVNCTWTQNFARQALRWERRLEMGMEGFRFFDLVRWGIAAEYMNDYFEVEKTRRDYLKNAHFTKNKDEYFPIPLAQINFSKKLYQQNYGWSQ
ncbi:MAG: RagB/SusD family nutrient uptake outer membrane protein [Dysgonamonadaceae bacterium]|nr:RagB/SusD family nutrient uptake outer membrane protein [Dysgonamonadaceae bacterium]